MVNCFKYKDLTVYEVFDYDKFGREDSPQNEIIQIAIISENIIDIFGEVINYQQIW